jgi:hypothetical protein
MRLRAVTCVTLSLLSGCRGSAEQDARARRIVAAQTPSCAAVVERVDLDLAEPNGLSGLTTDGDGRLWTVAERASMLLRLGQAGADRRARVEGVPENTDLEALAWLRGARFAIGTESTVTPRAADLVLVAEVDGDRAKIVERLAIPYSELPVEAESNRGIEGLCHAEGHLLAAFEQVLGDGTNRRGLIVHRPPRGGLRVFEVMLTTKAGKFSGLECRRVGHALHVIAVERHFGVHRVITFDVPLEGNAMTLDARLVCPLEGKIATSLNPEGITWQGDSLLLVVDNDYGGRTGPNELLRVRLRR